MGVVYRSICILIPGVEEVVVVVVVVVDVVCSM